ncbi:MAG: hypothetical protein KIS78_04495 [Labilithrix sp.]|nr:hypothetical protein [Labilithrix sp.]
MSSLKTLPITGRWASALLPGQRPALTSFGRFSGDLVWPLLGDPRGSGWALPRFPPRSRRRRDGDESPLRWTQQPWKLVSILWPIIVSALLPAGLRDVLLQLPDIALSLRLADGEGPDRCVDDRSAPRQLDDFRMALSPRLLLVAA